MDHFLSDAKRLVQRLQNHDNAVDILISETTNLQNKLIAMRQYHDEVNQMNQVANHRARSTLILGSQLENQRIQNLEQENRELSISLAEHQSALELIMNKYREQVLMMMKANGTETAIQSSCQPTNTEIAMSEKIAEMAYVMRQSASIDENVAAKEIETLRSLQVENNNLRELLEISGKAYPASKSNSDNIIPLPNCVESVKISPENMDNKDSGIYEEESTNASLSQNNVNKLIDYKPRRIKSKSKHINNLQNLFENPITNPSADKNTIVEDVGMNEEYDNNSYKLYTIERFIPNVETNDIKSNTTKPEEPLSKTDFLDMFRNNRESSKNKAKRSPYSNIVTEIPDIVSKVSKPQDEDINKDLKHIFSSNTPEKLDGNNSSNENDVLQMLDNAIDFDLGEFQLGKDNETLESQIDISSIKESDSIVLNEPMTSSDDNTIKKSFLESYENSIGKYDHLKEIDEMSDNSSECSEVTVVDASEHLDGDTTITTDEENALADMDSFLDDQFEFENEDVSNDLD